jgi:eukaryotic-like serine/threonine-protein kinase
MITFPPTRTRLGTRATLPPELERRALALVDDLVEQDDAAAVDRMLAAEDAAVRARVRRLLGRAQTVGGLPTFVLAGDDLPVPERVGVFALVEEVGAGGMGRVWRGERADGLFEQTVAVKLLRASPTLLGARFAEERRILARLDHPGIARLIDGGVAEGVPYLVMEFVRGRHIDAAARGLPLAGRVALLREAAVAVQFAHARLVVHADLKPSNIVVDEGGRVRLLDFGVARLIGDTAERSHPMTPAYASPARRAGRAPTIADDVFALGRLLATLTADARDSDLAAIAERATAEDERRRYTGVGDLIADLDRWRDRLPVSARAPTVRYRAARFLSRHRIGVAAAALALGLLSATSIWALLAARAESRQRAVAERRFDEVRALSRFMLTDLYDELGNAPGTVAARVRIAEVARRYLDRLAATAPTAADLRLEIAQGFERLARVQGLSGVASLGRPSDALASLARADALNRTLPPGPATDELAGQIALDRWTLAPDNSASFALSDAARRAFTRALAADPARQGALLGLLLTDKNRAVELIWTEDKPKAAIPLLNGALARLDRTRFDARYRDDAERLRINLLNRLGDAHYYAGDNRASLAAFRRAQAIVDRELAQRETLAWLELRGETHFYVSGALEEDEVAAALEQARAGVVTMQRVLSYGPDANAEKWLAVLYNQEASLLAELKRPGEAATAALASVAIRERRAADQPADYRRARDLAIGLKGAAETLEKAGRAAEACALAQRSVTGWQAIDRRGRLGKLDAKKAFPEARAMAAEVCG